ncbi:2,5-dichloro-2,5-cyclohexadiene-1,4-diol dehydrogenase [Iodidimonas nitroreducens]|uniref:2,5-dichloro-2,5-cyclohexadiene-1,4-diol dehydrogenase n=1 Tax=Iodidimonas nitroreducens TaxID=1236968 RepID=A0A5A7N2Z9_9PROT|nr:SDR family oxidoreductase [Iodidimonas nitroreducens]GAK34866.1 2,5-dichloro-2,5-cyclohexadiene-1,4-diol dehydrogenase [alpha proteobacterium Q-1]GER02397.1 2,5-dichloro-2,5-cyclohexadiene-1,4-diol dehydrogenase [Iodidimonas nitroreducens]
MNPAAPPLRFHNARAVVTGGTSGIGAAVVNALIKEGARVVYCGLPEPEGSTAQHSGETAIAPVRVVPHDRALCQPCDVRDDRQTGAFIAAARQWMGGLDLAVNCAGISHAPQKLADLSPETWRQVMATNADGIFHALRHEIPAMLESAQYDRVAGQPPEEVRGRAIVNIASILGTRGAPWMAAYGASKHAVVGLTQSAARDYATMGLRINAISPGPVETPMLHRALADIGHDHSKYAGGFPPAGPGQPADIAAAVLFLLSPDARYINGANLSIDGAITAI